MNPDESRVAPYLEKIRTLDFVKDLRYEKAPRGKDAVHDGIVRISTPKGPFEFWVETKNSYLDRSLLNALVVQAKYRKSNKPLLLFARYIPRPSAERLIDSRVNFVDRTGNMHLVVGRNYERTVVGNKEANRPSSREKSITPAKVQFLFTLVAQEKAKHWTVRQLAEASGLSKSNAAQIRQQLVKEDSLRVTGDSYEFLRKSDLEENLLRGYEQILRPKLLVGRFRSAESSPDKALETMRPILAQQSIQWSLTGGLAAYELQRFYKGTELVLFVHSFSDHSTRELRFLPDSNGPITLLRSFGTATAWKQLHGVTIAHPWLIYSELMRSPDPRAHEAAAELKGEFLNP